MRTIIRNEPIRVLFLTGPDAQLARHNADNNGIGPCFSTENEGMDGLIWESAADFEHDYRMVWEAQK